MDMVNNEECYNGHEHCVNTNYCYDCALGYLIAYSSAESVEYPLVLDREYSHRNGVHYRHHIFLFVDILPNGKCSNYHRYMDTFETKYGVSL